MPQKWGFSPICDPPRFFFKNRALSLLYPHGALTSCKKLEKNNERTLRYLKTDQRTDGLTRAITKDPLGRTRGPKMAKKALPDGIFSIHEKNNVHYFYVFPSRKMIEPRRSNASSQRQKLNLLLYKCIPKRTKGNFCYILTTRKEQQISSFLLYLQTNHLTLPKVFRPFHFIPFSLNHV